jgi:glycine betaine/proline transport system substrate-binding protein
MSNQPLFTHGAKTAIAASLLALGLAGAAHAQNLPGKGVSVQPLKSSLAEEAFQTLLVARALEKLGYDVQPMKDLEPATEHLAIANGDATFMATHWNLLHADFYKNSGGDAKLYRKGVYSDNAAQGYLIDKKTAERYQITNLAQLKDPQLAKLFDTDGDGKADLTGCNPGWGCELAIERHLKNYQLGGSITHKQGSYAALIADTIARFKQGQPILYYTWTPYWVSAVLRPGTDVVWLDGTTQASNCCAVTWPEAMAASRRLRNTLPVCAFLAMAGRLVVADVRVQRRHQHQRAAPPARQCGRGWLDAHGAVVVETGHAVGQQAHALQKVVDHHGAEHVQLEVARRPADVDGHVVAHDLAHSMVSASHCVGLTLPGMMDEPGSFSGMVISPSPLRGPLASQRTSLAIFIRLAARVLSAPWACTSASQLARASNLLGAVTKGSPVRSASSRPPPAA